MTSERQVDVGGLLGRKTIKESQLDRGIMNQEDREISRIKSRLKITEEWAKNSINNRSSHGEKNNQPINQNNPYKTT